MSRTSISTSSSDRARSLAAVLPGLLAAGVLDQDPPHGLGRGGEEVAAALPALDPFRVDQSQVRLVNQGRRLESLPGCLLRSFCAASFLSSS